MLAQLDHPGVVRLIDHTEGPPARIRTAFVGPDTWHTKPPAGAQVAPALAALATTVADLHEAGHVHGDLRPEHILIDPAGQPVLCGLAHAGPAEPAPVDADVRALVALGREVATHAGDEREAIESLLTALEAGHDDLRGTVRGLGRRRLPPAAPAGRIDRRVVVAGIVVAVAAVAGLVLRSSDDAAPVAAAPAAIVDDAPTQTTAPTTTSTDPPPLATPTADATELIHDGRRYLLGREGDVVVTGDWDCDGTPTPALLRPATGAVAVFADWPAPDAAIRPTTTTVVDGAIDLSPTDEPCPALRAITATGSRLITAPESS